MIRTYFAAVLLLGAAACHNGQQSLPPAPVAPKDTVRVFKASEVDSKKDPVCGMPSTAGLEDTLHVNGKVIGFCSKECKAEYVKAPKQHPVEWK